MTIDSPESAASDHAAATPFDGDPVPHASPARTDVPRFKLYTEEFAANPHRAYAEMRQRFGALVPVDLAPEVRATLVVGYRTALRILNDPDHFPADPRRWQSGVPKGCPVLPMLEWRPNALRSSGNDHVRYRSATNAAIDGINMYALHGIVERAAVPQINSFCGKSEADLLREYVHPLVFTVLNTLIGCASDIGDRVARGTAAIFDGVDAEAGNDLRNSALIEHTVRKRKEPGDDITSRLMAHPSNLTDEEIFHQLATIYAAGIEPQVSLIANTLLLMFTDNRFGGNVLGGSLSTNDALDEVLFADPPMANFCATYPRQPILIGEDWLPANEPVLISMAACNNDPGVRGESASTNRSHLAYGAGPHACPAQNVSRLIAGYTIDQLLDALPEISLSVPIDQLKWRTGPFHRSLQALPITFPPSPPLPMN